MQSLPLFHRIAGQPVIVLGDGEAAAAKRRLVERAGGVVLDDWREGLDRGARLAFVAFEDRAAAETAAVNLRCAGALVNVVDRPELCDFTTPSVLDRKPLLIAVGTGGASAGLAKQVRLRLEGLLPPTLGALALALNSAREALRRRWPDGGARRRAIDTALAQGGPLDVLDAGSAGRVSQWLEQPAGESPASQRVEITLLSGDPDDLTLRQARLLGEADVVLHDASVPEAVLTRARADAVRVELGTEGSEQPESGPSGCDKPDVASGLTVLLRAAPQG